MKIYRIFVLTMAIFHINNYGQLKMEYTEFTFILQPSSLGGIGVFAACDIPEGTLVFRQEYILRILKIKDVPQPFIKYCIYINDEECLCPEQFDRMEIGWFINHSDAPNIVTSEIENDEKNGYKITKVYTIRDIKFGEEILIDYNHLDEPEHLKEDFYKKT